MIAIGSPTANLSSQDHSGKRHQAHGKLPSSGALHLVHHYHRRRHGTRKRQPKAQQVDVDVGRNPAAEADRIGDAIAGVVPGVTVAPARGTVRP